MNLIEVQNHIISLEEALMRVHNFPSHPGNHPMDLSQYENDPPSWREGWFTAVNEMQKVAIPSSNLNHES
jgi:hypothetical protein